MINKNGLILLILGMMFSIFTSCANLLSNNSSSSGNSNSGSSSSAPYTGPGSLDNTFNSGTGANNEVRSLTIQSDGKIIIVGTFTNYVSTARNYIARLNTDGSLDATFNTGTGANGAVYCTVMEKF